MNSGASRRNASASSSRPRPSSSPGVGQEQARLADQIERQVCKAQILFQLRRMPDPLAQALAEHEARIAEAQHVAQVRRAQRRVRLGHRGSACAHRFFTSSGIS